MRRSWHGIVLLASVGCQPSLVLESDASPTSDLTSDTPMEAATDVVAPDVTTLDTAPPDTATIDVAPTDISNDIPTDASPIDAVDASADVAPDAIASACRTDRECAAGTFCQRPPGTCVQCVTASQCAAGQVCASHRCVAATACMSSRTCPAQVCDLTRMLCVDCLTDADCATGETCRANACLPAPHVCHSDRECSAMGQVCDLARSACVDCLADTDCASGEICASSLCGPRLCTPGATRCADASHLRRCDARGAAEAETTCAMTEQCSMGACVAACTPGAESCVSTTVRRRCNPDGLTYTMTPCASPLMCVMGACTSCVDTDGDSISDALEGAPSTDTDRDGRPDFQDDDSDGDGFSDRVEATRTYPTFESSGHTLTCGAAPDDCDATSDGVANFRDGDSDNDGVTDLEERVAHTNPCAEDTDGDGATDLLERTAGSSPTDRTSTPPSTGLYVVLPYHPVTSPGAHVHRELSFATRIRQADVFFLIDNSASMQPIIDNLRTNLSSVIVPGIQREIPDVRIGVGSFDSMPEGAQGSPGHPGDYTLWVRQITSDSVARAQAAFNVMHTIDTDTGMMFFGGDGPEDQTEAAFEIIQGDGSHGHETDEAARRSVRNALDPTGNGWVPRVNVATDCSPAAGERAYGWGCFTEGRVPIIVLASDAPWYDGCVTGSPTSVGGHNCAQLVSAMNAHGAFFIGIDVGTGVGGFTYNNAQIVATMTRSVDGSGMPIVFGPGRAVSTAASSIVSAVATLAGQTRQDITTRTLPDSMALGLPMGRTTANFIRATTPTSGVPDMPTGYERRDATTFYNVAPSTRVTFDVDFYNDFVPATASAQLFTATIQVLGRAGTTVDSRPVYILVPAAGM